MKGPIWSLTMHCFTALELEEGGIMKSFACSQESCRVDIVLTVESFEEQLL